MLILTVNEAQQTAEGLAVLMSTVGLQEPRRLTISSASTEDFNRNLQHLKQAG